jgi:hypothetical protein
MTAGTRRAALFGAGITCGGGAPVELNLTHRIKFNSKFNHEYKQESYFKLLLFVSVRVVCEVRG